MKTVKILFLIITLILKNKFEPVSLQTQIHLNVQKKVWFEISRIQICSKPQNLKKWQNLNQQNFLK